MIASKPEKMYPHAVSFPKESQFSTNAVPRSFSVVGFWFKASITDIGGA